MDLKEFAKMAVSSDWALKRIATGIRGRVRGGVNANPEAYRKTVSKLQRMIPQVFSRGAKEGKSQLGTMYRWNAAQGKLRQ